MGFARQFLGIPGMLGAYGGGGAFSNNGGVFGKGGALSQSGLGQADALLNPAKPATPPGGTVTNTPAGTTQPGLTPFRPGAF